MVPKLTSEQVRAIRNRDQDKLPDDVAQLRFFLDQSDDPKAHELRFCLDRIERYLVWPS